MYDQTASSRHPSPTPSPPQRAFFPWKEKTFLMMEITQCKEGEGGGRNGGLFWQKKKKKYCPKNNATEEDSRAGDRLLKHKIWHLHQMWFNYKTDVRTVQTFKITKWTSRLQFGAQTFPRECRVHIMFSLFNVSFTPNKAGWPTWRSCQAQATGQKLSLDEIKPMARRQFHKKKKKNVGRQKESVLIYAVVCVFRSNEFWFRKPEHTKYQL